MKNLSKLLGILLLSLTASAATAGPVIIAGTDADDHGFATGTTNMTGWLFMQKAFENIAGQVSNGRNSIVCLGCNGSQAGAAFDSSTQNSALTGSWTFANLTSLSDISGFFDGTGAVNIGNAGIIYMPTVESNIIGGISDAQLALVNAQGAALNSYLAAGGGLFTQEQANSAIGYGWLTSLLPGLIVQGDNGGPSTDTSQLTLTAAGNAAFPGLTNADASNATPWHAWFSGNFGGLQTLITGPIFNDAGGTFPGAVVLGGGAGTVISCGSPGQPACDVPEPDSLPLMGFGLLGMVYAMRRRFGK
jgi:hypothetical protein